MVTDGEIPKPDDVIPATISKLNKEIGLEVHGLIVASNVSSTLPAAILNSLSFSLCASASVYVVLVCPCTKPVTSCLLIFT